MSITMFTHRLLVLLSLLKLSRAQSSFESIGFGAGPTREGLGSDVFIRANQNPLNQTSINFLGFDFDTDPNTSQNATKGQWAFHTSLSIVNVDTNETNYAIASAPNTTSNILYTAYSLDFPEEELPLRNESDWTLCSHILYTDWSQSVLDRAINDPGDCSVALGSECLQDYLSSFINSGPDASTGCVRGSLDSPACDGISASPYGISTGSAAITNRGYNDSSSNTTNDGLRSGDIFSFESTRTFSGSEAQAYYHNASAHMKMVTLSFGPRREFLRQNGGQASNYARAFCTVLNKEEARNGGNVLDAFSHRMALALLAVWALVFGWESLWV